MYIYVNYAYEISIKVSVYVIIRNRINSVFVNGLVVSITTIRQHMYTFYDIVEFTSLGNVI